MANFNLKLKIQKNRWNQGQEKSRIGLCNVQRQLELTYKDFKLDVKDEENTFKVQLAIDLFHHVEF